MLRVFVFFAMFPGLAFSQLQTNTKPNPIQLNEPHCVVRLSADKFAVTKKVHPWGPKVARADVPNRPDIFHQVFPFAKKIEWVITNLPTEGSEEWKRIIEAGAERLVVVAPQTTSGCFDGTLAVSGMVEYVKPSGYVYTTATQEKATPEETDSWLKENGFLPILSLPTVTSHSNTSLAVVVIDSGIEAGDPDLLQQDIAITGTATFVPGGTALKDPQKHGTVVARLITGREQGIATSTPVIAYQVLGEVLTSEGKPLLVGSEATVLKALWRLHSLPYQRLIVNMSIQLWGDPELWAQAFKSLEDRALFVVAAGNDNRAINEGSNFLPASLSKAPNAITVGGTSDNRRIGFSSYGQSVLIGAPGSVKSGGYWWSGTSFSTPAVTAATVAVYEKTGVLFTPAEFKTAILSGARFTPALIGNFAQALSLDAHGALEVAKTLREKTSTPQSSQIKTAGIVGTWSGSSSIAYGDLVTIQGENLVDREYKDSEVELAPIAVYLNGYAVRILSASPEKVQVALPPLLETMKWAAMYGNPSRECILGAVRLNQDRLPLAETATAIATFSPKSVSIGLGLIGRPNEPDPEKRVASESNPVRAGEMVTLFLSGVEALTLTNEMVEISFREGDGPQTAKLEKTQVPGVFSVTVEVPSVRGVHGLFGKISARGTHFEFGVNYVGPE